MKKFLKKKLGNEKGMTLIELLAVIVILAIIAAIAIPAIGNIIENSRHNAVKADYQNALAAANLYFTQNDGDSDFTFAEKAGYLDDSGSLTDFTVTKGSPNTITGTATPSSNVDYEVTGASNEVLNGYDAAGFFTASRP